MKINIDKNKVVKTLINNVLYPLLSMGIVLALWAIIAVASDNPLTLPMPDVVLKRFFTLGGEANFWASIGWTILRTFGCFALSFVLALLFAAIGGLFNPIHKVLAPIVSFLRAAPTVAVIYILYAFMQNEQMTIVVGFLIAFPIMYSSFYSGIIGVDKDLLEMAKVYKLSAWNKVVGIYLPSITPTLFDTSKSTISLTLKVIIAAEILTSVVKSIGGKVQSAYAAFEVDYLLAYTLIAIVFSFVLEGIVAGAKKLWEVSR